MPSLCMKLIRLARMCSHVYDFHARNKCLTAKLLKQGYQLRKAFSPSSIVDTINWFQISMSD